jgi:hypothetical protein
MISSGVNAIHREWECILLNCGGNHLAIHSGRLRLLPKPAPPQYLAIQSGRLRLLPKPAPPQYLAIQSGRLRLGW